MRYLRKVLTASIAIAALSSCGGGDSGPPLLSISADSPPAGTAGAAYAGYTFTALGGTPPWTWSESGPLPPGLILDPSGSLSGSPTIAGTYPVSVTVTDSAMPPQTATAPVSLVVSDTLIVIAPASPPAGTVSYPYPSFVFSASGGSPPYTWNSTGTLPPGLTLGSDGTVSGTPTQVGTFAFSVTATDGAQQPMPSTALATQIQVNNPPPLMLNAMPAPPDGVDGAPYGPFMFSTTGGFQPFQWRITAGSLPPGLALGSDGSLSGTPTSIGTFTFKFTVTVTDSAPTPVSSSQPFTMNVVLPPPPMISSIEAPTGTVGVVYPPYQFTAGGLAPLVWSETPSLTMGLSLDALGVLSGTPTAAGKFPITLNVTDAAGRAAAPSPTIVRVSLARPPAAFTPTTGGMSMGRAGHAATLLLTGKVLVTGGGGGKADPTAELYDPGTRTFSPTTGNMTEARSGHTATLLNLSSSTLKNYGKVLIVGSVDMTAELYDPAASTFAATGSMTHARTSPTATLLKTDKVLIVGGNTSSGDLTAELYDPATGTFSDTGNTTILRTGHTATLLLDGRVLITGGTGTATAELYDPTLGTFTATTGSMTEARTGHTATRLGAADGTENGSVLIIGTDKSADLYDPNAQTFARVGSLLFPTGRNTASLRNDGTVLAAGGAVSARCRTFNGSLAYVYSVPDAALFAPESDGFTVTGSLNVARDSHTATVLHDGSVLVIGGYQHSHNCLLSHYHPSVLSSAELFQ